MRPLNSGIRKLSSALDPFLFVTLLAHWKNSGREQCLEKKRSSSVQTLIKCFLFQVIAECSLWGQTRGLQRAAVPTECEWLLCGISWWDSRSTCPKLTFPTTSTLHEKNKHIFYNIVLKGRMRIFKNTKVKKNKYNRNLPYLLHISNTKNK